MVELRSLAMKNQPEVEVEIEVNNDVDARFKW